MLGSFFDCLEIFINQILLLIFFINAAFGSKFENSKLLLSKVFLYP